MPSWTKNNILSRLFIAIFAIIVSCSGVMAQADFKIKNIIQDKSGNVVLINGDNSVKIESAKIALLKAPDRAVIDVPNAILIGQKKSIDISDSGIINIKVAQFSTNPNIVRIVFTAESRDDFKNLTIKQAENTLVFSVNKLEMQKNEIPLYQDKDIGQNIQAVIPVQNINTADSGKNFVDLKNVIKKELDLKDPNKTVIPNNNDYALVINSVRPGNNHVIISGSGSISLKESFILQNPTRLVYDIQNSTVQSKDLLQTLQINSKDILKIGQFDPDTVRFVIQTNDPDNYTTVISPDSQSIVISPKSELLLSEIPNGKIPANIKNIDVIKKDKKTTIITLTADSPLIHNIRRLYRPDRIALELFNLDPPQKRYNQELKKTEQFLGLDIKGIDFYPGGSSWVFPLKKSTKVYTKLSLDGKSLQLTMKDIYIPSSSNSYTDLVKGKVVIDPGHGGTDPGAQRMNIFEKDINLVVAQRVQKYLADAGIRVVMTRMGDEAVSLNDRTVITNRENPDAFISIHVNSSTSPIARGLETHWFTPQSKPLAEIVEKKLADAVNSPDRGIINSKFYVIHWTEVPAVLVEIGFISNDNERCELLSDKRQDDTARAIADGIIQFLNSK